MAYWQLLFLQFLVTFTIFLQFEFYYVLGGEPSFVESEVKWVSISVQLGYPGDDWLRKLNVLSCREVVQGFLLSPMEYSEILENWFKSDNKYITSERGFDKKYCYVKINYLE